MRLTQLLRVAHARGRLLPALVVVAVVVVLIEGAWRTSHDPGPAPPASPPPESPAVPPARSDLDKAPLAYAADYFLQLGERTRGRLLLVGEGVPAIVLEPGLAVAAPEAAEQMARVAWRQRFRAERARVAGGGGEGAGVEPKPEPRLITLHRELGLALFALFELPVAEGPQPAFREPNPDALLPGASVAAVSLGPDGRLRVVPGHLVSRPRAGTPPEVSLSLPETMGSGAVVDLDGAVFALLIESAAGAPRWLSLERVIEQAEAVRSSPGCRSIEVSEAAPGSPGAPRGLRVDRVAEGAFVGEPTPRVGDVLVEWVGPVSTADELQRRNQALPAWALADFVLLRGGRRLSGRVTLPGRDCAPGPEPPLLLPRLGVLALASDGTSFTVIEVARSSPAGDAGLRNGDRIVDAGRQRGRLARRRLESYEAAPGPLALGVLRDGAPQSLIVATPPEE